MNRIQITGILPALVSPVNEDGSIREAALRKLVRDLARTGISGFYLCGATGEGIAMAPERRMELVEIVKDEAPSGMKLINHIGAADLATVRRLARHSRQIGLDAISSVPPFFFSYDEKGVLDYYRAMAEASEGLPLLVYASPLSGAPLPVWASAASKSTWPRQTKPWVSRLLSPPSGRKMTCRETPPPSNS